jgi:hypothetical protein
MTAGPPPPPPPPPKQAPPLGRLCALDKVSTNVWSGFPPLALAISDAMPYSSHASLDQQMHELHKKKASMPIAPLVEQAAKAWLSTEEGLQRLHAAALKAMLPFTLLLLVASALMGTQSVIS